MHKHIQPELESDAMAEVAGNVFHRRVIVLHIVHPLPHAHVLVGVAVPVQYTPPPRLEFQWLHQPDIDRTYIAERALWALSLKVMLLATAKERAYIGPSMYGVNLPSAPFCLPLLACHEHNKSRTLRQRVYADFMHTFLYLCHSFCPMYAY